MAPADPHRPDPPDAAPVGPADASAEQPPPSGDQRGRALVDFRELAGRLWVATGVLGALALGACIVDALLHGLTFALMARWAAAFVAGLVVVVVVLVAIHAAGGARRARARGERLAGPGLLPPRRRDP